MTTISPFSLSLPYRTENRRFSTLSCTKTDGTQPKLSAVCFVIQSCLADADFVVFSNYCLIGTRHIGLHFCCIFTASPAVPAGTRSRRRCGQSAHRVLFVSYRHRTSGIARHQVLPSKAFHCFQAAFFLPAG